MDTTIYNGDTITLQLPDSLTDNKDFYQWWASSTNPERSNPYTKTYTITNAQAWDDGSYQLIVNNYALMNLVKMEYNVRLYVETPLATTEIKSISSLFYPNPTAGKVHLLTTKEIVRIQAFSTSGQLLKDNVNFSSKTIDLSEFQNGVYILKLQLDDNSYLTEKIVIQK